jgi:elongator complex protein 3
MPPDMVKIYPCVVLPSAELAEWHARGEFKPLEGEELIEALITMKSRVPYYCRLSRVIRDFPSTEISGGNAVTNLRDVIKVRMKQRGLACKCLRCREAGHVEALPVDAKTQLFVEEYENAGGRELFLSVEDDVRTTVLGFLRLRLPDEKFVPEDEKAKKMLKETREAFSELRGCAFVRELHTYGQALAVRGDKEGAVQHKGVGKRLMAEAERLARERGYRAVAVISGVGVKEYYRDLGYKKAGTYMKKRVS